MSNRLHFQLKANKRLIRSITRKKINEGIVLKLFRRYPSRAIILVSNYSGN